MYENEPVELFHMTQPETDWRSGPDPLFASTASGAASQPGRSSRGVRRRQSL